MTSHAVCDHVEAIGILYGIGILVRFPLKAHVCHSRRFYQQFSSDPYVMFRLLPFTWPPNHSFLMPSTRLLAQPISSSVSDPLSGREASRALPFVLQSGIAHPDSWPEPCL